MTDPSTARLALPLLAPGQAQKEMYHNEALLRLDFAAQASVLAAGLDSPPEDPAAGAAWIVGDSPEGDWEGHAGEIAGWNMGWRFVAPREGMRAWVADIGGFALFSEESWHLGETYGRVIIDGVQVVGTQAEGIDDPSGGTVVDVEARAAVAAILTALRTHGLVDTG